ncbi:helix-turn-helix domain-containing protein [Achromobacter aegrifaciens]|uniref:helix-turn-helix domain-containing protein n=1 Tax=Achromobacter aegrifaciens TaxID=1287736 RepID=UPI00358F7C1D
MKLEKRTYGDLVARAREKRGLGRADLAKRLGVSPSYVGFVEQGRRDPPPTALRARIVKELCLSEWDAASLEKLAVRDRCLTALARVEGETSSTSTIHKILQRDTGAYPESLFLLISRFSESVFEIWDEFECGHNR